MYRIVIDLQNQKSKEEAQKLLNEIVDNIDMKPHEGCCMYIEKIAAGATKISKETFALNS